MVEISVSILGIKKDIPKKIDVLNNENIDYLHIDVMDGKFVPNKTEKFEVIKKNLENNKKKLDIHLMVKDVKEYIKKYQTLNPEYITFHYEINDDIMRIINLLHEHNIKVGLSIKPSTDVALLIPYLEFIDLVLIMTVEPGKGGQPFMNSMVDKINELIEMRKDSHLDFKIEVDGGINNNTIKEIQNVDIAVVGSYITSSNDYKKKINALKENLK